MIACDRLPRLADLLDGVAEHIRDFPVVLAEALAGQRQAPNKKTACP